MKLALCLVLASLASCAAVSQTVPPRDPTIHRDNRVSIYLGQRNLDEDDWEPVDEQATLGFEYAYEPYGSTVGFEVGIMGSSDDDEIGATDVEGRTGEIYAGVKKTFGEDVVRPYVGGGLAFMSAEGEIGPLDDDDSSAAFYFHLGLAFAISESFFLGLDVRGLAGSDLELGGIDVEGDYGQLAIVMGFGF